MSKHCCFNARGRLSRKSIKKKPKEDGRVWTKERERRLQDGDSLRKHRWISKELSWNSWEKTPMNWDALWNPNIGAILFRSRILEMKKEPVTGILVSLRTMLTIVFHRQIDLKIAFPICYSKYPSDVNKDCDTAVVVRKFPLSPKFLTLWLATLLVETVFGFKGLSWPAPKILEIGSGPMYKSGFKKSVGGRRLGVGIPSSNRPRPSENRNSCKMAFVEENRQIMSQRPNFPNVDVDVVLHVYGWESPRGVQLRGKKRKTMQCKFCFKTSLWNAIWCWHFLLQQTSPP